METIYQSIEILSKEKGIDMQIVLDAVKDAMLIAARKHFRTEEDYAAELDEKTGALRLFALRKVVEQVTDPTKEMTLEQAVKINPDAIVGSEVRIQKPTDALGRIYEQTAKQLIFQKVREAERETVYNEYSGRVGELVNCTVKRIEGPDLILDLGKTEARLPKKEQSRLESFTVGDRVRCVIRLVDKSSKGPGVLVSRAAPELVMRLFEQEVPEIYDGTVAIKGCAREAGERTKIAVQSRDRDVDSVGACVGMKGMRVQSIIRELRGEKIDIIPFSEDIIAFAQKSLSPAKVTRVQIVDPENHHLEVIVEDTQLSLAIGKKGQNVRLASKLIGWNVDIKSEEEKRQEIEAQMAALTAPGTPLSELKGVGPKSIEKIEAHGVTTVEKLADMTPEQLTAIPGIGEKMVEKIQIAVAGYFQSLEQQQAGGEASPPVELEEQPGGAEQLASEEAGAQEAPPEEVVPRELDAAAEQHTEAEANEQTSPGAVPHQSEASSEPGASEEESAEQKEKSTGE